MNREKIVNRFIYYDDDDVIGFFSLSFYKINNKTKKTAKLFLSIKLFI